jgi:tRNA U54 and U55 pseudouridine synthase Pus10
MLGEGRPFIVEICDPHSRHRRRAEPSRAGAHAATRLGDAAAQAIRPVRSDTIIDIIF